MATYEVITRRAVLLVSARECGALRITGTADAGGASTLDDNILVFPNTDQIRGENVRILDGTAQGDDRIISAFTPASDRVTVVPDFSATIDTTSVYGILKKPWLWQTFIDGLDQAVRTAREHDVLVEKVNTELIGQDILFGQGTFTRWAAGNSAAPSGWTLDGNSTIARRTENVVDFLPYSTRITSDGTNLSLLNLSVTNFHAYAGQTIDLRGFIRTNTASRVTIDITDGVTTQTSTVISAAADLNEWRHSEASGGPAVADITVDDNPTELTINLRVSAGGAVQAAFAMVRPILKSRQLKEFDFPLGSENTRYKSLHAIEIGASLGSNLAFSPVERLELLMRRPQQFRVVDREGTPRLWIERGAGGLVAPIASSRRNQVVGSPVGADRPIRLHGYAAPAIITSEDTNVQMNALFLTTYMCWYAATTTPLGPEESTGLAGKIAMWERQWKEALDSLDVSTKAGTIPVFT